MNKNRRFTDSAFGHLLLAFVFSAVLVTINVIRIFRIPITIDETGYGPDLTYLQLMRNKIGSANSHILHSLFRKFFVESFGNTLFFLRVDSLIAQCLFLLFTYRLCSLLFKNLWWQLCSFILLNTASPLIFNFWGLSRGYALGLTCMTISIYYLLRYIENKRSLFFYLALAGAILSVYSNFGYINYYIAISGVIIIQSIIFRDRENIIKELVTLFIATCVLALMITAPLISVYKNGELSFLGRNGFIDDTIRSLAKEGLFLTNPAFNDIVKIVTRSVVMLTCLWSCYWVYTFFKKHSSLTGNNDVALKFGVILWLLLIIPALSLITQHWLFNINYLTDRTALFFIFLFVINLTYWLYYLRPAVPKFSWGILLTIFMIAGYNFSSKLNLTSTLLWWFDSDDLAVLKRITDESKDKPGKIKLHAYWLFVPSFKYDIEQKYNGRFEPIEDNRFTPGLDTSYDFYYIANSENQDTLRLNYHRDTDFVGGGFILYKKNR
jgi:hypothetical protein